jgi:hypothetical protein
VAVAVSGVVFVLSLARQAYALRLFAKRGSQCRQLCYHITAGAIGWGIAGGAACLALISMAKFPPLAAASMTVLAAAGGDAYTDSGRILARVTGIIALRSAMPGVPWSEIIRVFESGQSIPQSDLPSKLPLSRLDSPTFGPQNASMSESSSNDSSKSNDSGS